MEVVTLESAISQGLKKYFTGEPCKNGHIAERRVCDRSCHSCRAQKSNENKERSRKWYIENKERHLNNSKEYYKSHKEAYIQRAREWEKKNPEKARECNRKWRRSEKGRQQARDWVAANPEKHRENVNSWKSKNPGSVLESTRNRQARKINATPSWLTDEHRDQMRAVYAEAKKLSQDTGIKHHVDHIIPLRGKTVSGLHVPWNLQILQESANCAKGNQLTP